jgi:hypothetical protein
MIDPAKEHLLSLSKAARKLPRLRNDRPVSPSTLWRWATGGLRGVRLETIKVGGSTCTSAEALARFFIALSGARAPQGSPRDRDIRGDAVERELNALGV